MKDCAFNFTDFIFQNDHPNTIIFIGTCTQITNTVRITYTGADITSNSSIPQEWLDLLKDELNEDYDYGPYKKSTIKKIFKDHNRYLF